MRGKKNKARENKIDRSIDGDEKMIFSKNLVVSDIYFFFKVAHLYRLIVLQHCARLYRCHFSNV